MEWFFLDKQLCECRAVGKDGGWSDEMTDYKEHILSFLNVWLSGGELTAEVTADYLRREHLPDRAFSSEKARYYQPAGTMP